MNTEDHDAEWGKNIDRIVLTARNDGKQAVYQASQLQPNRTVVYLEMGEDIYVARVGRIDTHKTSGNVPEGEARIQLDIPGSPPIYLKGHIEIIPYGYDKPTRYELILDHPPDLFQPLGEYEQLKRQVAKETALKQTISQFLIADKSSKVIDRQGSS
jgi:hypothetical protein